jgi:uridine phosphorylase
MESSTLFTLGRLFGVRTGAVFAVLGNRMTNEFRAEAGIDDAIDVAVDAVRRLKKTSLLWG